MRKVLIIAIGIFLFSCNSKPTIEGGYTKVKENDRGSALNVFQKGLVDKVNFGEKICRFDYFGKTISGIANKGRSGMGSLSPT
ncbi:MAG TPA: hypothetical protein PLN06_05840 [Bacteroidales bacterium]|nr:hypothetical protein [Bacteroidales bacterium]HCI54942.1 hypothetical protein [Bacteroidales bacterium]HOU96134.1 hypothetical protein [Bacteroidales bacterium]HQG37184.1 hypothetical protein [Bacteroidales bacterium]HQG53439.1 hypothetical protein [Bacteroidales bacterium]